MGFLAFVGRSRGLADRMSFAHTSPLATAAKVKELLLRAPSDTAAWEAAVGDDLHVRIGNAAPAVGKNAALAELAGFLGRVDSVGENFCELFRGRETYIAEMEVAFSNFTDDQQRIPCVVVVRTSGSSVIDVRFHLDPSPIP